MGDNSKNWQFILASSTLDFSQNRRIVVVGTFKCGMKPEWSWRRCQTMIVDYGAAVLFVAAAMILTRLLLHGFPSVPNALFFCAVILSAWRGGLGPGLFASILASTIIVFWLPWPLLAKANADSEVARFLLLLFGGFFLSWVCHQQRRVQAALRQIRDELEQRVSERTQELTAANEGLRTEITERKRTETLLDCQKRVLEMIAADAPLSESLAALIRLIEAQVPGMFGSVLLVDEQGLHLGHGAAPSLPTAYVAAIDGVTIGPEAGSCGTAAYFREPVLVKDIAEDPRWKDYRALALPHGLRACWSTPIFDGQRSLLGTFAMYYLHPALPEPEHLRLIEMATHIAAIAIDRHRCQAALQASEAKLKEAQRIANIGYWERDLVADRLTWSEGTYRIFGLPRQVDNFGQAELEKMIHPEDRQIQRQALADVVQRKRPYDVEYRIVRPDGEIRFVHLRDEIEYDASGKPIHLFGTVQDMTERKKLEAEVALRERQLNAFFTDAPAGLVLLDKHLRYVQLNKYVAEINGVSVKDHLGKTVREVLPRFAPVVEPLLKQVLATGKPILNTELSGEKPDQQNVTQHLMESFFPILGNDGKPDGVGIILVDITKRKQVEELLKAREQEIRAMVENSPDPTIRFDRELRRTYVNPAFVKINGVPKEALLGRKVGSTVKDGAVPATEEEVEILEQSLKRVFDAGQPLDFETTWPFPTGRRIFAVHLEPEFDGHAVLTSVLSIARDITELKASEEKLRQTEAELARVARLTMMGEFTAAIAHEVNQPLAAVLTNANAVSRWLAAVPPNLDEARKAVRRIARDGNRAGEVIKRIRAFVKKGEPARKPLNLNELVQETVALTQSELTRKNVSLQTVLASELPCIPADRVQLQQVLLNLVVNALDSMSAVTGRPRSLRISTDCPDPETVQLVVQDTGTGIMPQETEKLFEPFYTTKPDGMGMGLAISRSIVEAHGGRLWARPNDGCGATFQFTLPVKEAGGP